MIKVSIILPVYNAVENIRECLDSLVNQTLEDIEIITINDGSEDNSLKILKEYEKKYPNKVVVIDNLTNKGIGKSRNKGLKVATGEYIGFMDSDDYADLDMYEKYYNFAKENNLDVVNSYYKKISDNATIGFGRNPHEITNMKQSPNLLNNMEYGPGNKIFLRENVVKFNIKFEEKLKYEDMPFVLKNFFHAKRIGYLDEPLYNYRIRNNSETTTMDKRVFDMFEIINVVNEQYKAKLYKKEIEYLNIRQITRYMLQQKYQKDKTLRNKFIEKGYETLNNDYPEWKNNEYYLEENYFKRLVKNNIILMKLYVRIGV